MQTLLEWLGGYIWLTAAVLGAAHALQPGHGKTIVAAYLVGSRGTVRDALLLGIVVTLTHTATIYVLAAVAQGGALFLPMERLEPILAAVAAVLILLVGLSLLWAQWRRHRRRAAHAHGHDHGHPHEHPDTHDRDPSHEHVHAHLPGFAHSHADPAHMTSLSQVFLLGVSGGIVPCPEGLAVFLASLAGGQIRTGLLLVVVFSLGLAATPVFLGIVFVKASRLLEGRWDLARWGDRITWASAALITAVGVIYLGRALLPAA